MSLFWLGVLTGAIGSWALLTVTLVALRGSERGTPMAVGHWPLEDDDEDDDELESAHRRLLETDGRA